MKRLFKATGVVALLLASWAGAQAAAQEQGQGPKPVVTVAFSGYDELRGDIQWISKLASQPEWAEKAESFLSQFTGAKGLAGLDEKRPWGFILRTDGSTFPMYGFIPVTDMKQLLDALRPLMGEPKEEDGLYEVSVNEQTLYVKQTGAWALVAASPEMLPEKLDDPIQALDGLEKTYDLAAQVAIQNIPQALRQTFLLIIQMSAQSGMEQMGGESDEQYAMRKKIAEQALEQLSTAINDLDMFTVGLSIDEKTKTAFLEYRVTALAGSKTAQQLAGSRGGKTAFAGFLLSDAAVKLNVTSQISESEAAQAANSLATVRQSMVKELENQDLGEEELERAKKMINELMDVVQATLEKRTIDAALGLRLDPNAATLVAGAQVADAVKVDSLLRQLVEEIIEQKPDAAGVVKFDAEQHAGVTLHTASVPAEEIDQPEQKGFRQVFGDNLDVVFGAGEGKVYFSAGRDAMDALKKAIDGSKDSQEVLPVQITVAATPIARFAAAVAPQEQVKNVASQIEKLLGQVQGKDHVVVTTRIIPNGQTVRIELEEGILKVLGSAPALAWE